MPGSNELISSTAYGTELALNQCCPFACYIILCMSPIADPINPREHFLLVTFIGQHKNCKHYLLFVSLVEYVIFGENEFLSN